MPGDAFTSLLLNPQLPPDAYEKTMDANREAIKYTYEKLSEVYKESPTKETLEDIITFLQIQTEIYTKVTHFYKK